MKPGEIPLPSVIPERKKTVYESDIEGTVRLYAKSKGWYVRKFKSPNQRSVPDRIMISPAGQVLFVEFKAPRKTATENQERELQRLRDVKQLTYVIDNVADGKALVDEWS